MSLVQGTELKEIKISRGDWDVKGHQAGASGTKSPQRGSDTRGSNWGICVVLMKQKHGETDGTHSVLPALMDSQNECTSPVLGEVIRPGSRNVMLASASYRLVRESKGSHNLLFRWSTISLPIASLQGTLVPWQTATYWESKLQLPPLLFCESLSDIKKKMTINWLRGFLISI